jgi:hypothetical protein
MLSRLDRLLKQHFLRRLLVCPRPLFLARRISLLASCLQALSLPVAQRVFRPAAN